MTRRRRELGRLGEELAVRKIKRMGYKKIIRNYRCALGEIDLIAHDGETLVFLEIKTRKTKGLAYAKEAVDARKRRQLSKVALTYMKANRCSAAKARFDVVAVSLGADDPQIEVIKDAFELAY
jgi:putative endonuclease